MTDRRTCSLIWVDCEARSNHANPARRVQGISANRKYAPFQVTESVASGTPELKHNNMPQQGTQHRLISILLQNWKRDPLIELDRSFTWLITNAWNGREIMRQMAILADVSFIDSSSRRTSRQARAAPASQSQIAVRILPDLQDGRFRSNCSVWRKYACSMYPSHRVVA